MRIVREITVFGKKRWEYKMVRDTERKGFYHEDRKGTNPFPEFGLEGWELVSVINTTDHAEYDSNHLSQSLTTPILIGHIPLLILTHDRNL